MKEKRAILKLSDIPIDIINMQEALERIESFVRAKSPHLIVTADSSTIVMAQRDEELRGILRSSDMITPDGAGILLAAKILKIPLYERVSGIDLMINTCLVSAKQGYSIFLLGADKRVVEATADILLKKYENLKICGFHHGYFSEDEESKIVEIIKDSNPDILFVAMGQPKQEKWIKKHMYELNVPVCIGVGGSFDVISGRLKRAPKWMRDKGLEWLFRLIQEPSRIERIINIPKFLILIIKEKVQF